MLWLQTWGFYLTCPKSWLWMISHWISPIYISNIYILAINVLSVLLHNSRCTSRCVTIYYNLTWCIPEQALHDQWLTRFNQPFIIFKKYYSQTIRMHGCNLLLVFRTSTESTVGSNTVQSVLRDHCHERPPVLKDLIFLAEGPTFQCNWTCHKEHLSSESTFVWPMGWSFKSGLHCTTRTIRANSAWKKKKLYSLLVLEIYKSVKATQCLLVPLHA